jgi:hypothetical protein
LKYPKIPARAIRTIPFPRKLDRTTCYALIETVRELEVAATTGAPEPEEANKTIDNILKHAYDLDDGIFERLNTVYNWDNNPQISLDDQPASAGQWRISGVVEDVNALKGTIRLWLSGFDHFETVPIVASMPGWMLRPNVAFQTRVPRFCVKNQSLANVFWGKFTPQEYTYLSNEELFDQLTKSFIPD